MSSGGENERRDKEVKLKLYSSRGVQEYWIVDWQKQQIEVYRREKAALHLKVTLFANDELTSPLLANLQIPVRQIFA